MSKFKGVYLILLFLFLTGFGSGSSKVLAEIGQDFSDSLFSLQEAVDEALRIDPELREAKLRLEMSETEIETLGEYLQVSAGLQADRLNADNLTEDTLALFGEMRLTEKWSIESKMSKTKKNLTGSGTEEELRSIGVTYSPFDRQEEIKRKQKEWELAAQVLAYQARKNALTAQVREAYLETVEKENRLELAVKARQFTEEYLQLTNSLFTAGKIPHLDLLEAEQEAQAAEIQLTIANLNRETALMKLRALVGKEKIRIITPNNFETGPTSEEIDLQATICQVLSLAPEIRVEELRIELAEINSRRAALYRLEGVGFGFSVASIGDNVMKYSLTVGGPIFSRPLENQAELVYKEIEAATMGLAAAKEKNKNRVVDSYLLWRQAELGLAPCKNLLELAAERLRVSILRYENGLTASFEVIRARQGLTSAEESYWQAWLNLQRAREAFYQMTWWNPLLKQEGK